MTDLVPGGVYRFVNAKAKNVMDLSGGDGQSIIGYDWHGGDNQKVRSFTALCQCTLRSDCGLYSSVAPGEGRPRPWLGRRERRHW